MSNQDDIDSTATLIDVLQYGSPMEAAPQVERFISRKIQEGLQTQNAVNLKQTEIDKTKKAVADFRRKNGSFVAKPMQEAAMREAVVGEQLKDIRQLLKAGTWPGYDASYLAQLTPEQTINWHLELRSLGYKVRTTQQLMDAAAVSYEESFGQRLHRTGSPEEMAHRRVQDMKRESALKRGQPFEAIDEDDLPNQTLRRDVDGGTMTPADWTRAWMSGGHDVPDSVGPDEADSRYSRGFDQIKGSRKAASDRKS